MSFAATTDIGPGAGENLRRPMYVQTQSGRDWAWTGGVCNFVNWSEPVRSVGSPWSAPG